MLSPYGSYKGTLTNITLSSGTFFIIIFSLLMRIFIVYCFDYYCLLTVYWISSRELQLFSLRIEK